MKPMGARIKVPATTRPDFVLFGEDQSRILVTATARQATHVESLLQGINIPFEILGDVQPNRLTINNAVDVAISQLADSHYNSFRDMMTAKLMERK